MNSLRWKKAWRDLWLQKTRTVLVILSIAVGLFTFGMILGARNTITSELPVKYQAVHPAAATFHTTFFDDGLVESVEHMPEVAVAQGRHAATLRYLNDRGEWHDLRLFALDDYENSRVDIVRPFRGAWPPPERAILLERNSLPQTGLDVGDTLWVETSDGERRQLPIAGLVHDMNLPPAQITGIPYGYVDVDTLEWLGLPRGYNELHILAATEALNKAHVDQVAARVADKLERNGQEIFWMEVPEPGTHFIQEFLPPIILIMTTMGLLALLLSLLLAINVITAILIQQTQQIGVMKAVGGRADQIAGMYLRMVMVYGLGALALALPLSTLAAHAFSRFIAGQLNFDLDELHIEPTILLVEVGVGLLVPLLAALAPVMSGTRVTVREAIQDAGLEGQSFGRGRLEQLMVKAQAHLPLSRPSRLSLRNTFRRKGRLARTLLVLMLGGGLFMTVWSVRASLFKTLEETLADQGADLQVQLSAPERAQYMDQALAGVAEIEGIEYWTVRSGIPLRRDGTEGDSLIVNALPVDTQQFDPAIISGRWLVPGHQREVVVSAALLQIEPELKVGGTLRMRIGAREDDWRIVGARRAFVPPIAPIPVYVNADVLAQDVGRGGRADTLRIAVTGHDAATELRVLAAVEERLKEAGIDIRSTRSGAEDRRIFTERFNILTVILLVLAFLMGLVGGLGLMGTMSLNVLERRREIGVMRAIGASNAAVMRVVMIEGIVIGLLSWVGALLVSQVISRLMSRAVGMAFVKLPLSYTYDWRAPLAWLVIVILVGALASALPAYSAARLSVRETLAYE